MKKIKDFIIKYERIIIYSIFLLVVLWLLSLSTCNKNRDYTNQQATIDSLMIANQTKDSIINYKGQQVILQTAIVTDNQATIKKLTDSIFDLKKKNTRKSDKVASYVATYTDTELEEYLLGFKDTLEFKDFADSVFKQCDEVINYMRANTITIPRTVEDSSTYFKFKGTISQQGFKIDNLSFPDSTYTRFVEHKGGLFKRDSKGKRHFFLKKSIEVQTFHTNPYVKLKGINSVFYIPKAKQRWLERAIIVGTVSFITYKLIK